MNTELIFRKGGAITALVIALFFAIAGQANQKPLVWIVNSIESEEVIQARYQPLLQYLQNHLHRDIVLKVPRNYQYGLRMLETGAADMGVLGPSPFLLLKNRSPQAVNILVTMQSQNKPFFYGVVVVRKDAPYQQLLDLKGTRFAYGSPLSTLSFYYPAYMLLKAGVGIENLQSYTHLQRHDVVAEHVIMGRQDAGGIKESVANKYSQYLRVIAKTPPLIDHAIVLRKGSSVELETRLRQALLDLKDNKVLNSVKPGLSGFIEANNDVYDSLQSVMQAVQEEYYDVP